MGTHAQSLLFSDHEARIGNLETTVGAIPPAEDYNTVADIRAIEGYSDEDRAFCLENQIIYVFDESSTASDNGSTVLCPDDITPPDPGRWLFDQQLALKVHAHSEYAEKILNPLQTRFLVSDDEGNPQESDYSANSFAPTDHDHDEDYASAAQLQVLSDAVDAVNEAFDDKMDKIEPTEGQVNDIAIVNSDGNVTPSGVKTTSIPSVSDPETLIDNTPGYITIGDITVHKAVIINYVLSRGSLIETGVMKPTRNDDGKLGWRPENDDCGFVFTKTISGNEIRLSYTDNLADGNDGELVMILIYIPL